MNYLIDTHIFIWAISEKYKLSSAVKKALENADNSIFISAVTFWEISLKYSTGKLKLQGFLPEEMPQLAIKTGFQLVPLLSEESASSNQLILTGHKDPFDRMLVWQAIQRDLVLISKDEKLAQYEPAGLKILW